jgi:type I restriction enzyme S subunit
MLGYLASQARNACLIHLPSAKAIGEVKIDLPPMEVQKDIANKAFLIKNICDSRVEEIRLLDELIKARFVELFGDPKINEKKWDTGTGSKFYEVKGGKRIPKGMGYADGITAHPYLRATDMKNETILDDDIHYIDEDVFEKIKRYTVKGGDIYLTNVGVNLGMAGVIPDKYDGANLTENAVKLVPKTDLVLDGLFLAHYINSPGIQDYINERKMSVGVPKLAIFRIETMPLILPPMNLQIEFINFCKQVDKSKVALQKALDETQTLFDSLMQKYFG